MKIVIHERTRGSLTDDEYKYLLLLEFHEELEKEIEGIRKELGIPLSKGVPGQKKLYEKSLALVQKLNIPVRLFPSIMSLIEWGQVMLATLPVQVLSIKYQLNRKWLSNDKLRPAPAPFESAGVIENWYRSNKEVLSQSGAIEPALPIIQINKRLDKTEFLKKIEESWDEIDGALRDFERSTPFPMEFEHIPIRDLEVFAKIYRYRKNDKLKHGEIYKKLQSEHGISFAEGEGEVRRKYLQMRQLLLKLGFIKK